MSVNLTKGQTVSLTKSDGGTLTQVRMGLGWDAIKVKGLFGRAKEKSVDLDASALLFDANGALVDQVWFSQLASKDGAVQHTGDNRTGAGDGDDESIRVALTGVNPAVKTLVFVVNSYTGETFAQIENAFCRLIDETTGQEVARYDLSGSGSHTAQIMAKVTRDGAGWSMTALGVRTSGRTIKDMLPAVSQVL
ncbi:TerD family protein [Cellulomonas septica]|uniref:TerD family protein n=1 Tax=Cellulomonas septica TaxID=285080 RepID=A0ABX1JZ30_9CELL|nr:TerD family protein [Cellulomonas septica]